jgi:asparagine synthase (glutamine-hydrolysing)
MCGIAGLVTNGRFDETVLRRIVAPLEHRGPDGEGLWSDPSAGVGLGHRRLAIIDLSPAGDQPMVSADGRLVLTFNGEIYNHPALRSAVDAAGGRPAGGWRGSSDTETLLAAIALWGLDRALAQSAGMFAFALWDRKNRILSLVRDRFGEKPLFYGWCGGDFLFGSELKAFRAHPRFDNALDRTAVGSFARLGYVPTPLSIFRGIFKLPPGSILEFPPGAISAARTESLAFGRGRNGVELRRYWSYADIVAQGAADPIRDEGDALEQLEDRLGVAVAGQSIADVPVGAFLSGGIDSSTIVALQQHRSNRPVRTFSIGFAEQGFDESANAKAVAAHLGTIHREQRVTAADAQGVIPLLPTLYDEPFADSSQIPTFLVSRFARSEVTVALTGDGGDELFGGYARHFAAPRLWQTARRVPLPARELAAATLGRVPPRWWNRAAAIAGRSAQPQLGAKLQKALGLAATARSFDAVYAGFLDQWHGEGVAAAGDPPGWAEPPPSELSDAERTMYRDATGYLPDDILCKVDRASMAVSLETRVPFLDHRVAELAARLPLSMKVQAGRGKAIVRRLLHRHVPQVLVDRPKAGFAIPLGQWLRGPLRPWAEDLLEVRKLREGGWFDPQVVRGRWQAHLDGSREGASALWAILMFQAWERQLKDPPAA